MSIGARYWTSEAAFICSFPEDAEDSKGWISVSSLNPLSLLSWSLEQTKGPWYHLKMSCAVHWVFYFNMYLVSLAPYICVCGKSLSFLVLVISFLSLKHISSWLKQTDHVISNSHDELYLYCIFLFYFWMFSVVWKCLCGTLVLVCINL